MIETIAGMAVPQVALPVRLLAGVRSGAAWLFAHPMTAVALLAGGFGAVEHHEATKWSALARQHAATISAIQSANASAVRQATAAKEAEDAYNAKLAAQSDQTAADLRGRYHAAVLQLAAAQDSARRADLPGNAGAAQSSDGPGKGAGVPVGGDTEPAGSLAIGRDDALSCADNTARLQAVRDWALGLGH